ncbi:MAG: hypothetical protein AAF990_22685, partial [Bacteroidota bacterium]
FFINTSGKMSAFAGHATDDNNIFVGGTDYTDTEPEVFLYKLSEDGQIDRDLSSKIERGNLNFPRVQLIEGLPEDKILLHGVFSEYDGNPVSNKTAIIDQEGNFHTGFLQEDENAFFTDVKKIDDQQCYIAGSFVSPNGATSLVRITDLKTAVQAPYRDQQSSMGQIFPNPMVSNRLQIDMDQEWSDKNLSYKIIQLSSGRICQQGKLSAGSKHDIQVPQLATGAYSLLLKYQNQERSHIFVKGQ